MANCSNRVEDNKNAPFVKIKKHKQRRSSGDSMLNDKILDNVNDWFEFSITLTKLGGILFYFYLCDRSSVMMQENIVFSKGGFYTAVVIILIIGFLYVKKSKKTEILHRDQTEEWKGWMQLVILVYHYTGTSQNLTIYMYMRILVSSYLFMSGFGHTMYALTTMYKDTHFLHRGCSIVFRLNLLTVCLCVTMNTPYTLYYFVPLVTFWFMATYVLSILAYVIKQHLSHGVSYVWIFTALTLALTLIVIFIDNKNFFNLLFEHSGKEHNKPLWFRWSLDKYSTLYGIYFAIGLHMYRKKFPPIQDITSSYNIKQYVGFMFVIICTGCGLLILSFVILRNIHPTVTQYYSEVFAWFGKISLELFVCQFHIWLAADGRGLLVLIPGLPGLNFIIMSLIFVCVSHEFNHITQKLIVHFVPKDTLKIIMNSILFVFCFNIYGKLWKIP